MEFMSQVLDQLLLQYMLAIFGIGKELKDVRDEVVKHFDYLRHGLRHTTNNHSARKI